MCSEALVRTQDGPIGQLVERFEVVALLFNVSDIAITLTSIERFLKEDEDDGEEEADQG